MIVKSLENELETKANEVIEVKKKAEQWGQSEDRKEYEKGEMHGVR